MWRLEAGGYPPPGEERLRQDGDGEEDYRSLYQRERQEREVSDLTSKGTKMSSQLNSFAHSLFSMPLWLNKKFCFPFHPLHASAPKEAYLGRGKQKGNRGMQDLQVRGKSPGKA